MSLPSRRAVIAGAAGGAALALTGCGGPALDRRSGALRSAHWPGRDIRWQLVMPQERGDTAPPVVVVLHGKGGDASHAFRIVHLDDHVARTGLAVASVDGGDHYWHARSSGVDPGSMVVDDFLPLVREQTGYAGPVAFLGWSMGGYGSLLLASRLGPDRVGAVVAESAALWTEPGSSAAGAFDDREDFVAHDVFARTEVLRRIPVRLDCGTADPFVTGNRAFARALPSALATFDDGGHTARYWQEHGRAQLDWVATRLTPQ